MRPPMTAAKNDGISPQQHWKSVLVQQKEVFAENKKPLSQQQQLQIQTSSLLSTSINNDNDSSSNDLLNDFSDITITTRQKFVNPSSIANIKIISPTLTVTTVTTTTTTTTTTITTTTTATAIVNATAATTTTQTTETKKGSTFLKNVIEQQKSVNNDENNQNQQLKLLLNNFSGSSNNCSRINNSDNCDETNLYSNKNNKIIINKYSQQANNNLNTNSKLKRISSDVSDRRNNIKPITQTVSKNGSISSSLISLKTSNFNNNSSISNAKINVNSNNNINNNSSSNSSSCSNSGSIKNKCNNKLTITTASNNTSDNSILKNTHTDNTKSYNNINSEIPKNLIVNTFEQFQYDQKLLSSTALVSLPLSETEPLLTDIETTVLDLDFNSKRSICLNKNNASLIFTKKELPVVVNCNNGAINSSNSTGISNSGGGIGSSNNRNDKNKTGNSLLNSSSIVHLRTISGANSNHNNNSNNNSNNNNNINTNSTSKYHNIGIQKSSCDGGVDTENLLQRRRSLQLNYSSICRETIGNIRPNSTTAATNRKQNSYSWYAPVYSALEEEIEQDSRDSSPIHNLASTKSNNHLENETVSLLEKNQTNVQPQLHQPRIRRIGTCQNPPNTTGNGIISGQIHSNQNDIEGPQVSSLLGGPMPRRKRIENFFKSLVGRKPSKEPLTTINSNINYPNNNANPPILQSPEITITRTPSEQHLQREIVGSTTSLNTVQQKLWNVVPLLKREGSTTSLHPDKADSIVQYTGMRKCETVLALSGQSSQNGCVEQIKPLNRLRNSLSASNATCSRCSSLLSLAASGSRYSLNVANSGFISVNKNNASDSKTNIAGSSTITTVDGNNSGNNGLAITTKPNLVFEWITCKLCLTDVKMNAVTTIGQCGCIFCTDCMTSYVEFEISEGAYDISCPDAQCPAQGILTLSEIASLASPNLMKKHHRYRLNREIELDKNRTWCPRAGCETVCHVGGETSSTSPNNEDKINSIIQVLCAVQCPTCKEEFCSGCKKPWHPNISCEENNRRLVSEGQENRIGIPFDNDLIKCCPMCAVPIEKDEGCAQMMCKRCKHVFCWYCLASLDDDFLLRHYDKGPCKNKLGHSRASVVWHRAQVIGIFAGFGILLLVASPLLLLAAPCIICCKCRICSGATKLEDADTEFDDAIALQR